MVYIIQGQHTKEIKIGCSNNLSIRLKANAYEKGEPIKVLAILDGSFSLENRLRKQFRHIKVPKRYDIIQYIQQVESRHPLVGKEFLRIEDEIEKTINEMNNLLAKTQDAQTRKLITYFINRD